MRRRKKEEGEEEKEKARMRRRKKELPPPRSARKLWLHVRGPDYRHSPDLPKRRLTQAAHRRSAASRTPGCCVPPRLSFYHDGPPPEKNTRPRAATHKHQLLEDLSDSRQTLPETYMFETAKRQAGRAGISAEITPTITKHSPLQYASWTLERLPHMAQTPASHPVRMPPVCSGLQMQCWIEVFMNSHRGGPGRAWNSGFPT